MLENPQTNVDANQLRVSLEQRSIEINTIKERADSFEKKLNKAEEDKKRVEGKKFKNFFNWSMFQKKMTNYKR